MADVLACCRVPAEAPTVAPAAAFFFSWPCADAFADTCAFVPIVTAACAFMEPAFLWPAAFAEFPLPLPLSPASAGSAQIDRTAVIVSAAVARKRLIMPLLSLLPGPYPLLKS